MTLVVSAGWHLHCKDPVSAAVASPDTRRRQEEPKALDLSPQPMESQADSPNLPCLKLQWRCLFNKAYGLWNSIFGSPAQPPTSAWPGNQSVDSFFSAVVEKVTSLVNLAILGSRVFHRNEWRSSTVTISLFSVHHQHTSVS